MANGFSKGEVKEKNRTEDLGYTGTIQIFDQELGIGTAVGYKALDIKLVNRFRRAGSGRLAQKLRHPCPQGT